MFKVLANGEQAPPGAIILTADQIKQQGLKIYICMVSETPASVSNETTTEKKETTTKGGKKKKEVADVESTTVETTNEVENSKANSSVKKEKKAGEKKLKKDSRWCSNGWTCSKKDSGCRFKHAPERQAKCINKKCKGDCGKYHKNRKANASNADDSSSDSSDEEDETSVTGDVNEQSLTNSTTNS